MQTLNYKVIGKGEKTLFFLHELMGSCVNYEACIPYLNKEDFTYYFIDLRGYGLSKNILGEYNCNEAINDILALIKNLKLEKIYLIAHSMSALIAQKFAIEYSNYLNTLILLTPVLASGVKIKKEAEEKLLKDMKNNELIETVVLNSSKRYNQTWIKYRINLAYNCSTLEARLAYMKMYLKEDFSKEAKKIEIPVKVIVGKYDFPVFSKIVVKKAFELWYKDLEILEFEEAGHYPMIESPVLFASTLEKFCK